MNRRSFLRRLGAAAVALTLARHLPGIAPAPAVLKFRKDAFRIMSDPPPVCRFDVIYGFGTFNNFAVRVQA